MPSNGIDAKTGKLLTGWPHVVQSMDKIFTTRVGERVMLRQFGAISNSLLGRRMVPQIIILYRLLLVLALERWEPRVRVRTLKVSGTVDEVRAGDMKVQTTVDYLPRGHLGDTTVASTLDVNL